MKRRSFLQGTGIFLAAWSSGGFLLDRHVQVLAQPTSRKLALLIGINRYHNAALNGCVTDIELQKELLVHRFGFQPNDIVTVSDQDATRSHIETVFKEHLIQQAKPDDVVIVHFSGHGSLQKLGTTADGIQPTLLTVDAPSDELILNGLSQDTLLLLLKSLATDQITTVLDVGYAYPGDPLHGNLRVRARPTDPATQLPTEEITLQERLLAALNLNRSQVRAQWRSGQLSGVVLAAANTQQFATEAPWNGFYAGLFTYALTQQLWQAMPETTLRVSLRRTSELIGQQVDQKQQLVLAGQKSQERPLKPYQSPFIEPPADGVITAIEDDGKIVQLWLGGLPSQVLDHYGLNSLFTVEASGTKPLPLLQLYERNGLAAKARFVATESTTLPSLTIGQRVQEAVRVLPRNVDLAIAIDTHLKRIERVDAISAFSAMPRVSAIMAGEQAADYLFGKLEHATQIAALSTDAIVGTIPPAGYSLFSQGQEAILSTAGESGEAVKLAVRRLTPHLHTLLATKLLSLTANEGSSQLGVRATLATLSPDRVLMQQQSDRVTPDFSSVLPSDGKVLTIPVGSRIQYRIDNTSDRPIYFLMLGLDNSGKAFIFNNLQAAGAPPQPHVIQPNQTASVPMLAPNVEWMVQAPLGLTETFLICSRSPFSQTQLAMTTPMEANPLRRLDNLLEISQLILQDLHQASEQASKWVGLPDVFALDVNAWTTFRFIYQVTA
jgi:hypothetical protein